MKITVNVTQQDIDAAVQARSAPNFLVSTDCPVAQALKRLFPNKSINCGYALIGIGDETFECVDASIESLTKICSKDWPDLLAPTTFEIIPSQP